MKILVVCTGNTCRSPMAGGLVRKLGHDSGINLEVRTAGLAHHPNQPVAGNAVAVMKEIGIDISDEFSKPVTLETVEWADTIVFVQQDHAEQFSGRFSNDRVEGSHT
jgi:protein arginine phosphatase